MITRGLILPFLRERGFLELSETRKTTGSAINQSIHATLPSGGKAEIRVKLCWRPRGGTASDMSYWAAQLVAKVSPGTHEQRVTDFSLRARREGTTHFLFVQPDGNDLASAALVETKELKDIWCVQRDRCIGLTYGKNHKTIKNLAENGHSPTLYLKNESFPKIAEALWKHKGVFNVSSLSRSGSIIDDTFQDTSIIDYEAMGSDEPKRLIGKMSYVRRDSRVRRAVLKRAKGKCERASCGISRDYRGFLDVHHILGIGSSDRVWNCVALCPNCHREAHIAPESAKLNAELLLAAKESS
jgi:5-methylcytosine-specific restriction protein A